METRQMETRCRSAAFLIVGAMAHGFAWQRAARAVAQFR